MKQVTWTAIFKVTFENSKLHRASWWLDRLLKFKIYIISWEICGRWDEPEDLESDFPTSIPVALLIYNIEVIVHLNRNLSWQLNVCGNGFVLCSLLVTSCFHCYLILWERLHFQVCLGPLSTNQRAGSLSAGCAFETFLGPHSFYLPSSLTNVRKIIWLTDR